MAATDLPPEVRDSIDQVIGAHATVLYMKGKPALPQCGFSAHVVQLLRGLGVDFHSVNVLADMQIREAIKVYNDWPTVPQLFHKGKFIGRCDIVNDLAESGELESLLKA